MGDNGDDLILPSMDIHVSQRVTEQHGGEVVGVHVEHLAGDAHIYQGLSAEEVAVLVTELKRADQPAVWDGRNPYLGLSAFQEADAEFFFGRESLVDELLGRVREAGFIVISGPSGSGKSSVARAGLFHALRQGELREEHSERWLLADMQPAGDPVEQLARAVEQATESTDVGDKIHDGVLDDPSILARQVGIRLGSDHRMRFVLLVDQFEETFTQTREPATQAGFINLLTAVAGAEDGRIIVVLSMRSDFVSHCARFPELRALMSKQFQLVGAMEPADLAKAITLPALKVGADIDAELVSRIMADMKGEPGALPLMSFALRDLFEAEQEGVGNPMDLTLPEYLNRGGLESALERHANKVFAEFSEEQQELARGIFSRLIEIGQGRVDTRRTAKLADLVPAGASAEEVMTVVRGFAKEDVRLLTTDVEEGEHVVADAEASRAEGTSPTGPEPGQATVTIAHEKLIDAWPWLRALVDENRELIELQNEISHDARKWEEAGKDEGFLYPPGRLLQVEERLEEFDADLSALSREFVDAAIVQRQRREDEAEANRRKDEELRSQKRVGRILRWATAVVGILLVAAVILAVQANNSANLAATREIEAISARATSDANAELASTAEAEALVAQSTSAAHAAQAIDLAQVRLASSNELATAIAGVDDALATQEAVFAADPVFEGQLDDVQEIRNSLSTVFAQNLKVGLNINPDIGPVDEDVLDGLDQVRLVFKLAFAQENPDDIEGAVSRYEPIVEAFALRGISVLFILNQETFWGEAPWDGGDWDAYADEMATNANLLAQEMSRRYAKYGALIAYEIWNEPDFQNNPSSIYVPPDVYAVILERTASAIRSASPEAKIIFGSLASGPTNSVNYVRRVQAELGGTLPVDAIGWKPYGRWATFEPFPGSGWGFGKLADGFDTYQAAFPDTPIWVTEIGVASDSPIGPEHYADIAAYMLDVYQYVGRNYARQVPVVIWFAWSDLMRNAGIVDSSGAPKDEIYEAFADVRSRAIFAGPEE